MAEHQVKRARKQTEKSDAEQALAEELAAMNRLHDLAERLLSITNLTMALTEVLEAAIALHTADRGTIQFLEPETGTLHYAASRGFNPRDLYAIPPIDRDFHSTCAVSIRTTERVVATDLASDPAWAEHAPTAHILGYNAAISTPLKTRREDLEGVLTVHFRDAYVPTQQELRWADLYGRLAAHLIERGRSEQALRQVEQSHRERLEAEVANRTAELQVRVAERDALLKEVHHRVKNNLNVITSMLEMQARRAGNGTVQQELEQASSRVMAIAEIHELLYQSSSFAGIDLRASAEKLVSKVVGFYNLQDRILVDLQSDNLTIDLERAVPCGLVLNELISNTCKHAFPNGGKGKLTVRLRQEDGHVCIAVEDTGVGIPSGVNVANPDSLGLTIVQLLTDQLGGVMTVRNGTGTTVAVQFKASRH